MTQEVNQTYTAHGRFSGTFPTVMKEVRCYSAERTDLRAAGSLCWDLQGCSIREAVALVIWCWSGLSVIQQPLNC